LGGRAAGFHVQFLSTNHFHFSVSCKQVGFHVYRLRRVISSQLDVYFHLWNNGTPHWEREKRLWEEEQEKEWFTVLSKSTKRLIKKTNNKRVSFVENLVQKAPEKPAQPPVLIRFGSHLVPLPSKPEIGVISLLFVGHNFNFRLDRSRVLRDSSEMHVSSSDGIRTAEFLEAKVLNSNSNLSFGRVGCSRCLDTRHDRSQCANKIRCRACFNYGHVQRKCLTKARPRLVWIQKEIPTNRIGCKGLLKSRAVDVWKPDSLPSDESSPLVDEEALNFMAVNKLCADQLFYTNNGLPDGFIRHGIYTLNLASPISKPLCSPPSAPVITIPASALNPASSTTGTAIVPWKPIPHVMALQFLQFVLECRRAPKPQVQQAPVILLGWTQEEPTKHGPSASGPESFDFKAQQLQPNPTQEAGQKRGCGHPKKVLSLPPQSSSSPLVESSVRRSVKNRKGKKGFHTPTVRLAEEPSKKRNKIGAVLIDDATGLPGLIPVEFLQDWGIKCGIAPAELSQEALMQAPSTNLVPDEDTPS
jgi:hypothetical protein